MFASRGLSTPAGHRCTSSAKFTSTRSINHDDAPRVSIVEDIPHPRRSVACAFVSTLFCPILGLVALFYSAYAVRSFNQGYYAESTTFYKKSIRWSLITFIFGLLIGSIIALSFFVKIVLSG